MSKKLTEGETISELIGAHLSSEPEKYLIKPNDFDIGYNQFKGKDLKSDIPLTLSPEELLV